MSGRSPRSGEAGAERRQAYRLPPVRQAADGRVRTVGFELEFSGLTLDATAAAVRHALGGEIHRVSAAERRVHSAELGEFNIEIDWAYLKQAAGEDGDDSEWLERLSELASLLVPIEVVCPPVALDRLESLDAMVAALRAAGAVGTEESLIAAYGVHINAQIPSLDAATLDAYLKAFALLQWWLVDAHRVDPARRLSPYIDLYAEDYVRRVLTREAPTLDELFDDYLAFNPDRNRALDLLPLLAEIDRERVRRAVDDPRVKARPTFHYRLPNCHIERAGWSLAESWNTWCVVEALAAQPAALHELGAAFLGAARPLLGVSRADWVARIDRWLGDHESA